MPSGPKKRKAAKKKKPQQNNINPQENDELKSIDEKGSDGGEGSSPGHPDHDDHHHPFNEGSGEVEDRDLPAAQPSTSDAMSMEEVPSDIQIDKVVGGKEDNGVLIEREMKFEESSESKDVSFEHIELAKESYYGNENTSGPSNDESVTEKNSKDEGYNPTQEVIVSHELVKSIDSSPSKMTLIAENAPVEETGNSADESSVNSVKDAASVSEVEKDDTGSVLLEKSVVPSLGVTDLAMKINEDNVYPLADETARSSSLEEPKPKECDSKVSASFSTGSFTKANNGAEHIKNENTSGPSNDESVTEKNSKDEDYNPTQEVIVSHELVKSIDSSPCKMTLITENASVEETGNSADESSVNSVKDAASVSEVEKDDTGSVLLEKSVVPSPGVTDLVMKINEDNVYPLADETARSSSLEEPKPKECDSKVSASFSAGSFAKANNGAEHIKNENTSGPSNDESVTEKNSKDEDYNPTQEVIVSHELVKSIDSSPSKMTLITENAPVEETGNSADESSVNSVKDVASVSEVEKDDTGSVLLEKSVVPSPGVTDLAMKINEDNVYPLADETARSSSLEEPKPKECDSKVSASFSAGSFTKANNGAEHIKNSETRECSENQPLVASSPHMVQKTSWLSCCGLFEVLSSSNR